MIISSIGKHGPIIAFAYTAGIIVTVNMLTIVKNWLFVNYTP